MEKKQWLEPEVNELGVESTEHGKSITKHVDGTNYSGGFTFFSFS